MTYQDERFGHEPTHGRAYDHAVEGGRAIECRTDGRGGLIERELPGERSCYGIADETARGLRAEYRKRAARKDNAHLGLNEMGLLAVRLIEEHGPMAMDELAERCRVWNYQMQHALAKMRNRGRLHCWQDTRAAGRKFLWGPCSG